MRINVSRLRTHLGICLEIPEDKRRLSMQSSQRARQFLKLREITGTGAQQCKVEGNRSSFPSSAMGLSTLGSKTIEMIRLERNQKLELKATKGEGSNNRLKKSGKLDTFVQK